ncbi:GNAT family N-acetyltransferase [[Pantoea] beijingensis]|nr:GNAT family N-acetyltransferase [[Pantoea] beijingensis]
MMKIKKSDRFYNTVQGTAVAHAKPIALAHRRVCYDLNQASPAAVAAELGMSAVDLPEYCSTGIREVDIMLFNRCMSLGQNAMATREQIETIAEWMDQHANPNWAFALGSDFHHANIDLLLNECGFTLRSGGIAHYWRDAVPVKHEVAPEITIIEAETTQESQLFSEVVGECFQMDRRMDARSANLIGRKNWHCFIAHYNGEPAGTGAMMNTGEVAWLGFGGTLPQFRGKGIQQALLKARINKACELDISGITIESAYNAGEEQPFPVSGRNIQRLGFSLSHVSENYSRNKT